MLEKIAQIKQEFTGTTFSFYEIRDLARALESTRFIYTKNTRLSLRKEVSVRVIDDGEDLLTIAEEAKSCLYQAHFSWERQVKACNRFLEDQGALYLAIEAGRDSGYVALYAGQQCDTDESVLFEDHLRTGKKALYHPDMKAVVALALEQLGLAENSFLYVPFGELDYFEGERSHFVKQGSEYFKKAFPPEFYHGERPYCLWPSFARCSELLDKARNTEYQTTATIASLQC